MPSSAAASRQADQPAAVCLTPDTMVLEDEAWPEELRVDHRLNLGYHRARQMLAPAPLPQSFTPMKLASLERAGAALGHHVERAPLHISFESRTNAAGVAQPACSMCGDCMGGCNTGAKTTVHATYLADAVNHGAELFTGANVRLVQRADGNLWRVLFRKNSGDGGHVPVGTITAAMVVLAAGTFGTAEIMMRSREHGLRVSDRLGWRFTTNADVMSFGYNYDKPVNSVGIGHSGRPKVPPPGPAVVGLIDLRRRRDPLDRLALVEATVPSVIAALMPMLLATGAKLAPDGKGNGIAGRIADAQRNAESLVAGAYKGPIHHSHAFLAVGHDGAGGRLVFDDDTVAVHWPNAADEPVFTHISAALRTGVAANNGTYVPNPVSSELLGGNLMTVHPLGGCGMGRDRTSGVVDHKCRVFDGDPGRRADAVHDGLFICDGSIMPRPLGVHPLSRSRRSQRA